LLISFRRFAIGAGGSPQSAADGHANGYTNSQPDCDVSGHHSEGDAQRRASCNS